MPGNRQGTSGKILFEIIITLMFLSGVPEYIFKKHFLRKWWNWYTR
jgi:hypothetical protein